MEVRGYAYQQVPSRSPITVATVGLGFAVLAIT